MMVVFATYRNSDMIEGKGPMVLDKVFMEEKDAHEYINIQHGMVGRRPEHGWQNSDWDDWTVRPFCIMEHLQDGADYERQQLLERAYSKLTKQEKAAIVEHVTANVT